MNETYIIYGVVFMAIFLPMAFWRRETYVDLDVPAGEWRRLPGIFKVLWRPMYLLETSLGRFFAMAFPGFQRRYIVQIEIANLPLTGQRVWVAKCILGCLGVAVGASICLIPALQDLPAVRLGVMIVVPCLGWWLPALQLSAAAQLRQEEITRSLPFAVDLIGSAMRAGLEFGAALRYYAELGAGGALEEEFARVARDATLGKPISESLQDMAARVRIKTFTAFAGVIAYGTEIGASIVDTLKLHGAEMRRARFSIAEQKAARAPSVMIFPLALFILPAVFLIIFVPVMLQFIATKRM